MDWRKQYCLTAMLQSPGPNVVRLIFTFNGPGSLWSRVGQELMHVRNVFKRMFCWTQRLEIPNRGSSVLLLFFLKMYGKILFVICACESFVPSAVNPWGNGYPGTSCFLVLCMRLIVWIILSTTFYFVGLCNCVLFHFVFIHLIYIRHQ